MGDSITAKKLYERLLKDVFGKYNFNPDKWLNKPEDIGRTYFYDRKTKKNPFDVTCSIQLRKLYNSALHGDMTDQIPARVSIALNSVLIDCFGYDFGFLTMIESDKEELKEKKISYWLTIIDKISTYAISNPVFKKGDPSILEKEHALFGDKKFFNNALIDKIMDKDDLTLAIDKEKRSLSVPSEITKNIEKDVLSSSTEGLFKALSKSEIDKLLSSVEDRTQMNNETIDCIFFLDSIFIDIKEFVKDYRKRSSLHLCPFPEIEKNLPMSL